MYTLFKKKIILQKALARELDFHIDKIVGTLMKEFIFILSIRQKVKRAYIFHTFCFHYEFLNKFLFFLCKYMIMIKMK